MRLPLTAAITIASGTLVLAIVAAGAMLRLPQLDNRPMHCDEANQALKFGHLLDYGWYDYDPEEHHGPSLSLLTLPVVRVIGAENLADVTETDLRLVPAMWGIVLIGLVWLLRDQLGPAAACWAAALTALSPAMVFYSRYFIQEMLLVCFTFAAIVALWRYAHCLEPAPDVSFKKRFLSLLSLRRAFWLVLLGLSVGMMHASKETCIIALSAMAVAAAVAMGDLRRAGWRRLVLFALVVSAVAASSSALLFSAFFTAPGEVTESYAAYAHYFARAAGEGTAGQHDYPWYRYFQWLFWWHRDDGPVWTEASIAALAVIGLVAAACGKGIRPPGLALARFLGVYTVLMTLIYSAMPYKTPWCALGFLHGMILLAGIGAAVLVRIMPHWTLKAATVAAILVAISHLAWQAHRASFVACEDVNNPYVYAYTTSDVLELVKLVEQIAAAHPRGRQMYIQVVCPDDDYWPLPWYLRDFPHVGYFSGTPSGRPAPLIITQPRMEPALVEYLYKQQPPGQRSLYVPVPPQDASRDWQLRPHVPLRVYVQLDLWQTVGSVRD